MAEMNEAPRSIAVAVRVAPFTAKKELLCVRVKQLHVVLFDFVTKRLLIN